MQCVYGRSAKLDASPSSIPFCEEGTSEPFVVVVVVRTKSWEMVPVFLALLSHLLIKENFSQNKRTHGFTSSFAASAMISSSDNQ